MLRCVRGISGIENYVVLADPSETGSDVLFYIIICVDESFSALEMIDIILQGFLLLDKLFVLFIGKLKLVSLVYEGEHRINEGSGNNDQSPGESLWNDPSHFSVVRSFRVHKPVLQSEYILIT